MDFMANLWNLAEGVLDYLNKFRIAINASIRLEQNLGAVNKVKGFYELSGRNRLVAIAIGYEFLRQALKNYDEVVNYGQADKSILDFDARKKLLPQAEKELQMALDWKRKRNTKNFASCLEKTIEEYERKTWENSVYYDNGAVIKPGISEAEFLDTIENYRFKLVNADRDEKYFRLIKKVNKLLNEKDFEKVKEDEEIWIEFG